MYENSDNNTHGEPGERWGARGGAHAGERANIILR